MNELQEKSFILTGVQAAEMLISSDDIDLNFERAGKFLFEKLKPYIERLSIYIRDESGLNFFEKIVCTSRSMEYGSDTIPFYQLPMAVTQKGQASRTRDDSAACLLVPLRYNGILNGLLELRVGHKIGNDFVKAITSMTDAISLGLNHILLLTGTIKEKTYFEAVLKITNHLQTIDNMDELLSDFVTMSVRHLKFDRVSVFISGSEAGGAACHRFADSRGEAVQLKKTPRIPELKSGPEPLKNFTGYWIPLRTNMGSVGAALFDNIFSGYPVPRTLVEILPTLCSQFASIYENMRLFTDIQHNARHDKLTGLYNRAFFEEELQRLDTARQLPLSVVIGDLNGLKITNDVFGHTEGDNILKSAAKNLMKVCRAEDITARWGGDEFIILLPQTPEKAADEICTRIRSICRDSSDTKVQISISLGHATKALPDEDMREALKKAEDRMYRHKLLESRSFRSTFVSSLKETLFEKCQETSEHIERMEQFSVIIGTAMGLSDNELDELKLLAMLHDVGKVAINGSILDKKGKLNHREWEEMRMHSEIGYRIAQASSELSQIADYILCHHERWDGSGYPLGKRGLEIPKLSRIISVIDAYDVMTHARSYKTAMSHKDAVEELERCSGKQFDPGIVDIFIKLFNVYRQAMTN